MFFELSRCNPFVGLTCFSYGGCMLLALLPPLLLKTTCYYRPLAYYCGDPSGLCLLLFLTEISRISELLSLVAAAVVPAPRFAASLTTLLDMLFRLAFVETPPLLEPPRLPMAFWDGGSAICTKSSFSNSSASYSLPDSTAPRFYYYY